MQAPPFWLIAAGLFCCGFSMSLLSAHGVPMLTDHGYEPMLASWVLGVLGGSSMGFAVVLGALSDRFGRRPVILLALTGLAFDYVLLTVAPNVWWLVLGRVVSGAFGATYTPAGAYIADVTPPEKRAASFGLIGLAFGLGFIAGPGLGGLLGQAGLRVPFIACSVLAFLNVLFGLFVMPESLAVENRRAIAWGQLNPLGALRAVWRFDAVASLVPIFVATMLAQQAMQAVWVPYTSYRYGWGVGEVGLSLAIVGILFAVTQGALVRPLVARYGELRMLIGSVAVATVAMFLFATATQAWTMYPITGLYCLGLGLIGPAVQSLMSRSVPADQQGLLQGAMATVLTTTTIVGAPIATGSFAFFIDPRAPVHVPGAPFLLGSALCLAALVLALRHARRTAVTVPVEVNDEVEALQIAS
jgi:DHA1 family tetracycline resistance protein-like MFS transporter